LVRAVNDCRWQLERAAVYRQWDGGLRMPGTHAPGPALFDEPTPRLGC